MKLYYFVQKQILIDFDSFIIAPNIKQNQASHSLLATIFYFFSGVFKSLYWFL